MILNSTLLFLSSEPVSSFTLQLLATLIGVFVGFGLVILLDRKKKKSEKEEKRNMIIDSLVEEMKKNFEGVNDYEMPTWDKNDVQFKGKFGLISISAFQSIVNGGDFVMLPTTLQTGIRVIYQHGELFNKFMNEIIGFSSIDLTSYPQGSIATTELIRRLREQKTELQTSLPNTIKELKLLKEK